MKNNMKTWRNVVAAIGIFLTEKHRQKRLLLLSGLFVSLISSVSHAEILVWDLQIGGTVSQRPFQRVGLLAVVIPGIPAPGTLNGANPFKSAMHPAR